MLIVIKEMGSKISMTNKEHYFLRATKFLLFFFGPGEGILMRRSFPESVRDRFKVPDSWQHLSEAPDSFRDRTLRLLTLY